MSAFVTKYSDLIIPEPNSGCWFWMGQLNQHGYGRLRIDGHLRMAHRVAFETDRGPIPFGLEIDHLCRIKCCCNPDHLEPVTRSENIRRAVEHKRSHTDRTVCVNGHPLKLHEEIRPNGHRRCTECARIGRRRWAVTEAGRASRRQADQRYRGI